MSHKLTKKQLQKLAQLVQPHIPKQEKRSWDWKYLLSSFLGIVGLLLALVPLLARPLVVLQEPLNPNDALTSPVVISSSGPLDLNNVEVATFLLEAVDLAGNRERNSISRGYYPPNGKLEAGNSQTVPFRRLVNPVGGVASVDVVLIVSFRPDFWWFGRKTKAFRFRSVREAGGKLRFLQQPPGDAMDRYNKLMEKHKSLEAR